MAGKGSKQRPTDMDAYRENYERIFGKPICVLTSNSTDKNRHYEEAGSVGEEMRLMQEKMDYLDDEYQLGA